MSNLKTQTNETTDSALDAATSSEPDMPCTVERRTPVGWISCGEPADWDVLVSCPMGCERIRHRCDTHYVMALDAITACGAHDHKVPLTVVAAYPRRRGGAL